MPPAFEKAIVDLVARTASGLKARAREPPLAEHVLEAAVSVGEQLRPPGGPPYYCVLCGRGPYTRKGYYLHLLRVHYSEILDLVREEIERVGRASRL